MPWRQEPLLVINLCHGETTSYNGRGKGFCLFLTTLYNQYFIWCVKFWLNNNRTWTLHEFFSLSKIQNHFEYMQVSWGSNESYLVCYIDVYNIYTIVEPQSCLRPWFHGCIDTPISRQPVNHKNERKWFTNSRIRNHKQQKKYSRTIILKTLNTPQSIKMTHNAPD